MGRLPRCGLLRLTRIFSLPRRAGISSYDCNAILLFAALMKDLDHTENDDVIAPRYRAIFISDVHLGTRTAQAVALMDFLRHIETDVLYLVGDIIDFWKVRRGPHWPQAHNDVLQKILRKVRKGTRVVFIPGNHDEGLRDYCGMHFGGVEIVERYVHVTAGGKRYVVLHGDEFDVVVRTAKWLAFLGDAAYSWLMRANLLVNFVRQRLGLP